MRIGVKCPFLHVLIFATRWKGSGNDVILICIGPKRTQAPGTRIGEGVSCRRSHSDPCIVRSRPHRWQCSRSPFLTQDIFPVFRRDTCSTFSMVFKTERRRRGPTGLEGPYGVGVFKGTLLRKMGGHGTDWGYLRLGKTKLYINDLVRCGGV